MHELPVTYDLRFANGKGGRRPLVLHFICGMIWDYMGKYIRIIFYRMEYLVGYLS